MRIDPSRAIRALALAFCVAMYCVATGCASKPPGKDVVVVPRPVASVDKCERLFREYAVAKRMWMQSPAKPQVVWHSEVRQIHVIYRDINRYNCSKEGMR